MDQTLKKKTKKKKEKQERKDVVSENVLKKTTTNKNRKKQEKQEKLKELSVKMCYIFGFSFFFIIWPYLVNNFFEMDYQW